MSCSFHSDKWGKRQKYIFEDFRTSVSNISLVWFEECQHSCQLVNCYIRMLLLHMRLCRIKWLSLWQCRGKKLKVVAPFCCKSQLESVLISHFTSFWRTHSKPVVQVVRFSERWDKSNVIHKNTWAGMSRWSTTSNLEFHQNTRAWIGTDNLNHPIWAAVVWRMTMPFRHMSCDASRYRVFVCLAHSRPPSFNGLSESRDENHTRTNLICSWQEDSRRARTLGRERNVHFSFF